MRAAKRPKLDSGQKAAVFWPVQCLKMHRTLTNSVPLQRNWIPFLIWCPGPESNQRHADFQSGVAVRAARSALQEARNRSGASRRRYRPGSRPAETAACVRVPGFRPVFNRPSVRAACLGRRRDAVLHTTGDGGNLVERRIPTSQVGALLASKAIRHAGRGCASHIPTQDIR